MPAFFPEGDTPVATDPSNKSLQKINSLLQQIEAKTGATTISGPVTVTNEVEIKNDSGNAVPISDAGGSLTVDGTVGISGTVPVTFPSTQNVSVQNASLAVTGNFFPTTQPVSGSVSVSNFPATQPVSGSVSVSNFPATQPVSGSVSVSNLPSIQPVSGSVSVSNFPVTQPVSGSVSVSNFPATQPVSGTVTVGNAITANPANWLTTFYYTDGTTSTSDDAELVGPLAATPSWDTAKTLLKIEVGLGCTRIGEYLTNDDDDDYSNSLTTVIIPNSVTSIGAQAFYNCTSLTSVTIGSGVTSIGVGAFFNCTSLASITIPNSVTSIGDSAFSGCTILASITIPNSVTSIGDYAFWYCTSLTSITMQGNAPTVGTNVFSNTHATLTIKYCPSSLGFTTTLGGKPTSATSSACIFVQPVGGTITANAGTGTFATSSAQLPSVLASDRLKVDGSGVTQPVSGTFWPATQPVSGTFWPATQPVSGTIMANAGTGTFATSSAQLPSVLASDRLKVDGSGVTQPVSGTFWPATQPVSDAGGSLTVDGSVSVSNFPATQTIAGTVTAAQSTHANLKTQTQILDSSGNQITYAATGTAGTPAADVVTVQGISSGTALAIAGTVTAAQSTHANLKTQTQILDSSGNQITYAATGTAGTPAADVVTVQGISSGTALAIRPRQASATVVTGSTLNTNSNSVLVENLNRQYLLVQNVSDTDMNINFGAAASSSTLLLPKNGGGIVFETGMVPTNQIFLRCSAAGKSFYILHA